MNDSFLEDLGLAPKETNAQNNSLIKNRHITTRKVLTPPVSNRSKNGNFEVNHDKIISSSSANVSKPKISRRSGSQEPRKVTGTEAKPLSSTPKSERKNKEDGNVIKPIENQMKPEELKIKSEAKVHDNKPIKDRRSGSMGNNSRYSDASGKENTRPSTDSSSSRESGSLAELRKNVNRQKSDSTTKKSDILEKTDPVVLLNAIKDLISRYTEQETVKVLRAMETLHINSQTNLIKLLMNQTDEIINQLNVHKNFENFKSLIEENEKMREDIYILRTRNEILQKKMNEMTLMREENISLKLKLKELQKQ